MAIVAMALVAASARADVVAHWSFDAPDDKGVYPDSVGNAHPATPKDPADIKQYSGEKPAPFGKAITLDGGPGAYLTIPPITTIQKNSFTVASWVIFADPGPAFVLADWDSGQKEGFSFGIYPFGQDKTTAQPLANLASTETVGRGRNANNRRSIAMQTLASKTVPFNAWHHLAWTWDRDNITLTTYLDGNMLEEFKRPPNPTDSFRVQNSPISKSLDVAINNLPMRIGSQALLRQMNPPKEYVFNGSLDELWVFDQALTPIQLRNLVRYNDIRGDQAAAAAAVAAASQRASNAAPISVMPINPTPTPVTAAAPGTPDAGTAPATDAGVSDIRPVPPPMAAGRLGAGRVTGIVACLTIVVGMASYLIWAVTERGKLRAAGRM